MKPVSPPPDFLERCLSTVPADATYRTNAAPRPRPDPASRKRLTWLVVAAAVPVITVLAVLPAKRWREARQNANGNAVNYLRMELSSQVITPNPKRTKAGWDIISPKMYRLIVMKSGSGYFSADTKSDFKTLEQGDYQLQNLMSASGKRYDRFGKSLVITESRTPKTKNAFDRILQREATDVSLPEERFGSKTTILSKSQSDGVWQGQPAKIYDYVYKREGELERDDPKSTMRRQYFVDPQTNLVQGSREYEVYPGLKEILSKETRYLYTPPYDDSSLFDVERIKRGANIETMKQRRDRIDAGWKKH